MAHFENKILACLNQIYGESTTKKFKLKGSQMTIGRGFNTEIRLKNPNVSRSHCTLIYSDHGWKVTDNNSQNGTYVSGRKLKPGEFRQLQCGDIIFLGPPSEMPEAFCYDDAFVPDDVEEHAVSPVKTQSVKRPAESEYTTKRKKKTPLRENSDAIVDIGCNINSVPAVSRRFIDDVIFESPKSTQTINSRIASPSSVSSELNEFDNGYQINEISSTGDGQVEDSQSILIENNDMSDPFPFPILPEIEVKPSSHGLQTSKNSEETDVLKTKLALLSKKIKNLEQTKSHLQKNYEDVCKKNKSLDEQLAEQNKLKEDLKKCELKAKAEVKCELLEKFEEDLICNICTELLIKPTVLDCSHTFCQFCIKEWKKKKNECPICRNRIQTMTSVLTLEHFIDKTLLTLTPEQRDRRTQLIKERENTPKKAATPTSRRYGRHGRRRSRRHFMNMRAPLIPSTAREGDVEIISERRNHLLDILPSIPFIVRNNVDFFSDSNVDIYLT